MFIVSLSCTLIILVLLNELLSLKLRICTKDTFKVNSVGPARNPISCYLQNRIMPFACPIIKFSTLFYKIAGNQGCKLKKGNNRTWKILCTALWLTTANAHFVLTNWEVMLHSGPRQKVTSRPPSQSLELWVISNGYECKVRIKTMQKMSWLTKFLANKTCGCRLLHFEHTRRRFQKRR